jgi:hypothetical protein
MWNSDEIWSEKIEDEKEHCCDWFWNLIDKLLKFILGEK